MGESTGISWTTSTFNAWVGCQRVSPGCVHCYAEAQAKRFGWKVWGAESPRRIASEAYWQQPRKWHRQAIKERKRWFVFCGSMMDIFEDRPDLVAPRNRLWELIQTTPLLTWQLLTKRPENIRKLLPSDWSMGYPNVWLGTTVEDQEWADKRISLLLDVPARSRFLSVEPMIGPLDIQNELIAAHYSPTLEEYVYMNGYIDWVICGGESGPGCRPMEIEWARSLLAQCRNADVAFFMKQLGGHPNKRHLLSDFPEDLRVQEFPE